MKKQLKTIAAMILCLTMILQSQPVHAEDAAKAKVTPTLEQLITNNYVLYYVNCGCQVVDKVADGEHMGLYQSVTDRKYGKDTTGYSWGLRKNTANSKAVPGGVKKGKPSLNKEDTYYTMGKVKYNAKKSGLYYDFELPAGNYDVVVGFKNPWADRTVNVVLEGTTYDNALKLTKNYVVESRHNIQVSDGELNVFVHNPASKDQKPLINYIIVQAVPSKYATLQAKIMDIETKLNNRPAGVKNATTPLSDLYLDAAGKSDTLSNMEAKLSEAKDMVKASTASDSDVQKKCKELDTQFAALRTIETYSSFSGTDGAVWKDTNGVPIQAHGGQVQRMNGKWWWYGEDKTKGNRSNGVSAYSSDDLYNWTFEGYVMRTVTDRNQLDNDSYFTSIYSGLSTEEKDNIYKSINNKTSIVERPKVIYNESTKKYVMWFHADGPTAENPNNEYSTASAGAAVSDSPRGPFKFINRYRLNVCPKDQQKGEGYESAKGFARDMNLFIDDDANHTAYIIYSSEDNRTMYISKLNSDYTYLATPVDQAVHGTDFVRLFPGATREAPAVFKYKDKYYMIHSGATGWSPNQAEYWMSDSMLGSWKKVGNPCVDDKKNNTFTSQSTYVIPYDKEKGYYIFMADRWSAFNLQDSRYIWLPVIFTADGKIQLKAQTNWKLEDLEKLLK